MRRMLKTCNEFAEMYDLKFLADKSKVLTLCPYGKRKTVNEEVTVFMIGSNLIEEVDELTHLRHNINNKSTDDDDVIGCRNSLVENFLGNFLKIRLVSEKRTI